MNKREAYQRSYEPRLQTTGPMVRDFQLYFDHLSPTERLGLRPQLESIQHHLNRLAVRLHKVTVATEDEWEKARDLAELAWADFQRAVDDAYALMHAPRPEALACPPRDAPWTPAREGADPPYSSYPSQGTPWNKAERPAPP